MVRVARDIITSRWPSRAAISNYIPQILWDVFTCPKPWYLPLSYRSTHHDSHRNVKENMCIILVNAVPVVLLREEPELLYERDDYECIRAFNVQTYIFYTIIRLSLHLILNHFILYSYDCIRDHIRLEFARMSSRVTLCSKRIVNIDNLARFNSVHSWICNYSTEHAIVKWTPSVISFY